MYMLPQSGKKHLETDFFSRSGKGQGVFGWSWKLRKYLKCQESSGNLNIYNGFVSLQKIIHTLFKRKGFTSSHISFLVRATLKETFTPM